MRISAGDAAVLVGVAVAVFGCSGSIPGSGGGGRGGGSGAAATAGTTGQGGAGGRAQEGGAGGDAQHGGQGGTAGEGGAAGGAGSGGAGAAGRGGSGSAAGASGGGGAGTADHFPKCLHDLFATCPLEGACVGAPNPDGGSNTCFASGVRKTVTFNVTCPISGGGNVSALTTTEVRKADGSLCYTRLDSCICGHACEDGTRTWSDDRGEEIAVETFSYISWSIRCSGSAEITACSSSPSCAGSDPAYQATDCTAGSCP